MRGTRERNECTSQTTLGHTEADARTEAVINERNKKYTHVALDYTKADARLS